MEFTEFIPIVHAHYNIVISVKFWYHERLNKEKIKIFQKE